MRALLLGNEESLFETVVAMALARDGVRVVRGCRAGGRRLFSRHHHEYLEHPPLGGEGFGRFMLDQARRDGGTVVLPLSDVAVEALQRIRPELDGLAPVAAAPVEATAVALDKARTAEAAGRVEGSLYVPEILLPDGADDAVARWTGPYPVLVKPRCGCGAKGIRLVRGPEELRAVYDLVARTYERPLVQRAVHHRVEGKFQLNYVFDHDGTLRSWFGHRIIAQHRAIGLGPGREKTDGGIALLWESAYDEELLERGRRLLEALGWRGVAVVEGAFDERDGRPYLFEINARIASTQNLSLVRDVNVALDACRVALRQPPTERFRFQEGLRAKLDPFRLLKSRVPRAIAAIPDPRFVSGLSGLTDPVPAAQEGWRTAGQLLAAARRRILGVAGKEEADE